MHPRRVVVPNVQDHARAGFLHEPLGDRVLRGQAVEAAAGDHGRAVQIRDGTQIGAIPAASQATIKLTGWPASGRSGAASMMPATLRRKSPTVV